MPFLTKRAISNFFRSGCQRRLRLDLSPDNAQYNAERLEAGMPPRNVRPGLAALANAGEEWERAKVNDLVHAFGIGLLLGTSRQISTGGFEFADVPLDSIIEQARPNGFLVQAQFEVGSAFETTLGIERLRTTHDLNYAELRPDLIQTFSPGAYEEEVRPDGSIEHLAPGDERLPLRLIDIKLTAEPSVPYYIEVTYYAMALAGWLVDNDYDRSFFVVPEAAVWPGSHEASTMTRLQREQQVHGTTPTTAELLSALEDDLEIGEFRVFAPRLRRFFQEELDIFLSTPWRQLQWHVDNRCLGCEYLGYPWPGATTHPEHCWRSASSLDHLSRVAFVSRGARGALEEHQINTVANLAGTQANHVAYDSHQVLRATRTVVASRAQALGNGQSIIPAQAGTSAVMPAWADLRIYLTADFDIGSGITIAFGFKAIWAVREQSVQPDQEHFRVWRAQAFPVDQRDLAVEQRELFRLLDAMHQAMAFARHTRDAATVQVYIWDSVTYDHLVRVIGRHLAVILQNENLRQLAWLFPPDPVVPNPDISDRQNPITIVRDVIRAVVAAPVPHYYSLLDVARVYHSTRTQPPYNQFNVPMLFDDPLSDQIPSERAHEIWSRAGGSRPWNQQLRQLESTVRTKINALESVAQRLGEDLRGQLGQTAPQIQDLRPPRLPARMADDARLWFVFAQLNVALAQLEIQKIHAMPPHEREARFKSAILTRRLTGQERLDVLDSYGLQPQENRLVYALSRHSREARAREGDFLFAISPVDRPGILSESLRRVAGGLELPIPHNRSEWSLMQSVAKVSIAGLDRDRETIVLDADPGWTPVLLELEASGIVDYSRDVVLDPIHGDYLINRLRDTLNAIGNPPIAEAHAGVAQAIGRTRRPAQGNPSAVADLLWDAPALSQFQVQRNLDPVRTLLTENAQDLNASQWRAWEDALTRRLQLIWGPPGTGKSRTLRAVVLGALHEALQKGRAFRVLITGPTYEAIDNVLLQVHSVLMGDAPLGLPDVRVARLRSVRRPRDPRVPDVIDVPVDRRNRAFQETLAQLENTQELVVVGATAQQTNKLLSLSGGAVQEFFDLILVDEASQLDVASSTLALSGLDGGGTVVIAGDPKQLPPIHQAKPPVGLESMVGPVFTYLEDRHNLQPAVLEENYRSCQTIVDLAYLADYPRSLRAYSPDLEINLVTPLPQSEEPPQGWPHQLFWTPEWSTLLESPRKASCFVYREGRSSQWNRFEADAIASLVWILAGRLGSQLLNERVPPTGDIKTATTRPYTLPEFWQTGIGIVTPHRAQQALIVSRLQALFRDTPGEEFIRGAVDTVERFQGQQRDIMLATFALGDPDAIRDEDEFLLSLNRFNVMSSRARAKLIVFASQELVDHLSSDMDVLRESALLKSYAESFCDQSRSMTLGYMDGDQTRSVPGVFRWRELLETRSAQ